MEVDLHQDNMAQVQPAKDGVKNMCIHDHLVDFIMKCKVGH